MSATCNSNYYIIDYMASIYFALEKTLNSYIVLLYYNYYYYYYNYSKNDNRITINYIRI